jgi:hypothetical protein
VAVVDKALSKNPDERYQHGGEMARDLRAALNKIAVESTAVM